MKSLKFAKIIISIVFVLPIFKLFSDEIILNDGRSFFCKKLTESPTSILVEYEKKQYEIPRSEILKINSTNRENGSSYYTTIVLKDNIKLFGVIAEETSDRITIETKLGFVVVPKKEIEFRSEPSRKIEPDKDWAVDFYNANNQVGISFNIYSHLNSLPSNPNFPISGDLFFEPLVFKFSKTWRAGVYLESLYTKGDKSNYEFINSSFYIQKNWKSSKNALLDFYFNFGPGISQITHTTAGRTYYTGNPETQGLILLLNKEEQKIGYNPFLSSELGWQGLKTGNVTHRFGVRYNHFWNNQETVLFLGFHYSLVFYL